MVKLVFLDIETTGLNFWRDRVLELGIVSVENGHVIRKSYMFNPKTPINKRAYRVHGISFDDVKGKPEFGELKEEILKFLNDAILVGFNILTFDIPFLNFELLRLKDKPILNRAIDLKEVMKFISEKPPNSLITLAKSLDVNVDKVHRALEDAETTRKIFLKLSDKYPETFKNLSLLEDLTFSNYSPKSLKTLKLAREYGRVRLKYFSKFYGVIEKEIVPFVIFKNKIIGEDEFGNLRNFYAHRIIDVIAP